MKKLFYLLLSAILFVSCSEEPEQETQDYTSFTITLNVETNVFGDAKTGYFNADGECVLLGEHGTLKKGTTDEFIMTEHHDSIYLFYIYTLDTMRLEKPFVAKKNTKNNFVIANDARPIAIRDKNIYNWPH